MRTFGRRVFPPPGSRALVKHWRVALRVTFGLILGVDAALKWLLYAQRFDYIQLIAQQADGQPPTIASWIKLWAGIASATPNFALLIAVTESVIAVFILLGFLTNLTAAFGIIFSFLIWSTAEGLGRVFTAGATDIGASPLYMATYAGLIVVRAGRQYGLDAWLTRQYPYLAMLL